MGFLHILAIPLPFQGHINPMLHFLSRISAPNLVTTLLVPEQDLDRTQRSFQENPFVHIKPIPVSVIDVVEMNRFSSLRQLFFALDAFEGAQESLVSIIEELHLEQEHGAWGTPISCLLTDAFVHMGQDLANKLGIPRIAMWTSGAASFLVLLFLETLMSQGILPHQTSPGKAGDLDLPVTCIPGMENLRKGDLPHSMIYGAPEELRKRVRIFSRTPEAACILLNSVEEIDQKLIDAMQKFVPTTRFLAIGPLLPSSFLNADPHLSPAISHGEGLWKEDVHCLSWLHEQEPSSVLYISFGSMANLSGEQLHELAAGVESSGQKFLWVIRPNLVPDELSLKFLDGFKARTSSRGLVINWAPQLQVLKHAAVGGFLTHCGWNSTLESMSSGVPMLGWPCFAEQNLNCKMMVDEWRVGLRFKPSSSEAMVERSQVERVIRILMEEETGRELRKRALEVRDLIRNGIKPGGSTHRNLHTFVDLLTRVNK